MQEQICRRDACDNEGDSIVDELLISNRYQGLCIDQHVDNSKDIVEDEGKYDELQQQRTEKSNEQLLEE